jgi:hypothetical protein
MNEVSKVLADLEAAATMSKAEPAHPLLFGACRCGSPGVVCLHCARWGAHFRDVTARRKAWAGGSL